MESQIRERLQNNGRFRRPAGNRQEEKISDCRHPGKETAEDWRFREEGVKKP
jgi:hypothetical protein